jgi:hypothetical protein
MPASAAIKSKVISWERCPLCTLAGFLFSFKQDEAGLPGATKADQPVATAQPGQSSPRGDRPGSNPASMSHSPPCWGASGALPATAGVEVAGDGPAVAAAAAGDVGALVAAGRAGCEAVGAGGGSVGAGGGLLVGTGGRGVGEAGAGESVGTGSGDRAGCAVGDGVNVLLGRAKTTHVRAGVGVGARRAGAHCVMANPKMLSHRTRQLGHRFGMDTSARKDAILFSTRALYLKVTRHKTRRWQDGC